MSVEGIQVGMCFTGVELVNVANIKILHPNFYTQHTCWFRIHTKCFSPDSNSSYSNITLKQTQICMWSLYLVSSRGKQNKTRNNNNLINKKKNLLRSILLKIFLAQYIIVSVCSSLTVKKNLKKIKMKNHWELSWRQSNKFKFL